MIINDDDNMTINTLPLHLHVHVINCQITQYTHSINSNKIQQHLTINRIHPHQSTPTKVRQVQHDEQQQRIVRQTVAIGFRIDALGRDGCGDGIGDWRDCSLRHGAA